MNDTVLDHLSESLGLALDDGIRAEVRPALEQFIEQGRMLLDTVAQLNDTLPAPVFVADV